MKKRILALILTMVMAIGLLTACGSTASTDTTTNDTTASSDAAAESSGESYNLIIATHLAEDHPITKAMYKFCELAEERSGGRLTFTTYINSELGDPTEVVDQIRLGVIDGGYFTTGHMAVHNDKLNATMWPYMFDGYEHAERAYKGAVGDYMKEMAADAGYKVLDWMFYGFRNLSTNTPINSVSDINGLKLRVPPERVNQLTMSAYGATCSTIAFSELYLALQQGVVDGEENPIASMDSINVQEVNKYIAMIEYTFFTTGFAMNPDKFDSLPEDLQQIIVDASAEAADYEMDIFVDAENEIIERWKTEDGVTFTYPDKEECRAAAQPALDELKKDYDEDFVEEWLNLIEESRTA
jgi:TRAP-type transport system periplasmic protein